MNTTLLKTFGQKARTLLIDGVTRKLHYWGFDKDSNVTDEPEPISGGYLFREDVFDDASVPGLWQSLKKAVAEAGVQEVAERAAYIWFNRLMALQILGKNGYEQPLLDPVSDEESTPIIVKRARGGQYNFLNGTEQERLKKILTDYEKETQVFAILLIGFCHSHPLLKRVFGGIDDYTELLLPDDILSSGGFCDLLSNGGYVTEADYKQVELIGWLYQFYISEKKAIVFKKFKDGKKAEAKDIPAATQIFTPNWIVKYMVENTVGKIWLEKHPDSPIKGSMQYLVEAADNHEAPDPIINEAKDLKLLDPAAGSGHILVEGFELLYKMYLEEYYPADEAVESILQHNLYGLDIDLRAAQLAQFAVLIKAAQYHPDVLKKDIVPHIYAMPAPVYFTRDDIQQFLGADGVAYVTELQDALLLMLQAQNLGAIMQFSISQEARAYIIQQLGKWQQQKDLDLLQQELLIKLTPYLRVIEVLTQQYEAIAANPPYMGQSNMNGLLKAYVDKNYKASKSDLFAVFMDVCYKLLVPSAKYGMINQQTWMFLGSYKNLRIDLLKQQTIVSMLHLGPKTFDEIAGEVVQSTSFIIQKKIPNNSAANYYRLVRHRNSGSKKDAFLREEDKSCKIPQQNFCKIPGSPIAYWTSNRALEIFTSEKNLNVHAKALKGFDTGGNTDEFLLLWHEVKFKDIGLNDDDIKTKRWVEVNRGGTYKKWYGNRENIVKFGVDGNELYSKKGANIRNKDQYFKDGITFSVITSGNISFRQSFNNAIFYQHGATCITQGSDELQFYLLGLLNSKVNYYFMDVLCPTLSFTVGDVNNTPVIYQNDIALINAVVKNSKRAVTISKLDYDSRELSRDFANNPLVSLGEVTLEKAFDRWRHDALSRFFELHQIEVDLSGIFINLYRLNDDINSAIKLDEITLLDEEIDFGRLTNQDTQLNDRALPIKKHVIVEQLISFAIGSHMGRYNLNKPGLHIAHPAPTLDDLAGYPYTSVSTGETYQMVIDEDGIMPLMGSKGNFADDAYNLLRQFLIAIWGEATLTANINFMQECLNQDIEDYLVKKFWGYHTRTYSKKPIYWLFSSKKGAFQALVYMHRMNRFTAEKVRDKYLLKHIQYLEQEITRMEINMAALAKADQKRLDGLRKDLQECNDYDLLLKDVATKQIDLDLDDGVTHNYELFKGVVAPIK